MVFHSCQYLQKLKESNLSNVKDLIDEPRWKSYRQPLLVRVKVFSAMFARCPHQLKIGAKLSELTSNILILYVNIWVNIFKHCWLHWNKGVGRRRVDRGMLEWYRWTSLSFQTSDRLPKDVFLLHVYSNHLKWFKWVKKRVWIISRCWGGEKVWSWSDCLLDSKTWFLNRFHWIQ